MTVAQLRRALEPFLPHAHVLLEHPTDPTVIDIRFVSDGRVGRRGCPGSKQVCVLSTFTKAQAQAFARRFPDTVPDAPFNFLPPT